MALDKKNAVLYSMIRDVGLRPNPPPFEKGGRKLYIASRRIFERIEVPYVRKIALRGLFGRKRESLLLWSVVLLAFLFLALPTTLITSLQATDAAQRISTYGAWQVMASSLSEDTARSFASHANTSAVLPLLPVSGANFFDGNNACLDRKSVV